MVLTARRVAIITDASRGIGAGLVAGYRRQDWAVVASARTIRPAPDPDVLAVAGDIAQPAAARQVVEAALKRFGRIDTLVNSAGVIIAKPFTGYAAADYITAVEASLTRFFWLTQRAIGEMAIDRTSLGYVAVPLSKDLGLSATGLGFAAGLVSVGFIVVPVPGNLIQYRVGALAWITGLLIAWSLVTAATAAVDSAATLYLAGSSSASPKAASGPASCSTSPPGYPGHSSPGPCRTSSWSSRSPAASVPWWRGSCSATTGWCPAWRAGGRCS